MYIFSSITYFSLCLLHYILWMVRHISEVKKKLPTFLSTIICFSNLTRSLAEIFHITSGDWLYNIIIVFLKVYVCIYYLSIIMSANLLRKSEKEVLRIRDFQKGITNFNRNFSLFYSPLHHLSLFVFCCWLYMKRCLSHALIRDRLQASYTYTLSKPNLGDQQVFTSSTYSFFMNWKLAVEVSEWLMNISPMIFSSIVRD